MERRSRFSGKSRKTIQILYVELFTQQELNTLERLSNRVRYSMVVDIRQFTDGAQNTV